MNPNPPNGPNTVVREPYPRWGVETALPRDGDEPPLILRTLALDAATPRPLILMMHGIQEHIGRYRPVAEYFLDRGFDVAGFDWTGHGLSNRTLLAADRALSAGAAEVDVREAYREQSVLNSLAPLRRDLRGVLEQLVSARDRPIYLLAHSLGGLAAASFLVDPATPPALLGKLGGIVLLAPALGVADLQGPAGRWINPVTRRSLRAEEAIASGRAGIGDRLVSLALSALFEVATWLPSAALRAGKPPSWSVNALSNCAEEVQRLLADGYITRRVMWRVLKGIEREIAGFRQRMAGFPLPYLLIYSELDPVTPAWGNRDFLSATKRLFPLNSEMEIKGAYHHKHLIAEPADRAAVLARIEEWLKQGASAAA